MFFRRTRCNGPKCPEDALWTLVFRHGDSVIQKSNFHFCGLHKIQLAHKDLLTDSVWNNIVQQCTEKGITIPERKDCDFSFERILVVKGN